MGYTATINLPEDLAPYAKELAQQRVLSQIVANLLKEYRDKMGLAYHIDSKNITVEELESLKLSEIEDVKLSELLHSKDDVKAYIKIYQRKRNQFGAPMTNYEAKLTAQNALKLVAVQLKVSDEELNKWNMEVENIKDYLA